ncbi:MAG: hypothetical protein WBO36_03195, partial [Saprospiraceae bacterium]
MLDFRYLCLTPDKVNNTLCTIFDAQVFVRDDASGLYFKFTANRFLKSMIRIIVARLMALGTGTLSMEQFEDVCSGRQIIPYKAMAYPQGLHLTEVIYPYLQRALIPSSLKRT